MAAASAGCLAKATTKTIQLSPEGTVNWVAIEREVRSTERDPSARTAEEQAYLEAARQGLHPVGQALAALAPSSLRTRILRDRRPFLVLTWAEFDRIDWLAQRALDRLGVPGTSMLERVGAGWRWTLTADLPVDADPDAVGELLPLVDTDGPLRVVLTSGRFTAATGFRLVGDDTAAELIEDGDREKDDTEPEVLVLSLTWEPVER
jgi:hypothetical protein